MIRLARLRTPAALCCREASSYMPIFGACTSVWNDTLARQPQMVIAAYVGSTMASWIALLGGITLAGSMAPVLLTSPALACGVLASRITRKVRQPVNLALAAGMVGAFPVLSEMKLTPLITGFAGDKESTEQFKAGRAWLEKHPALGSAQQRWVRTGIAGVERGWNWLQGPVDRYGLAFFVSSKMTSLATVAFVATAASRGVDVSAALTEWGFSSSLQGAAGTAAGAAVLNTLIFPAHLLNAIVGTLVVEKKVERAVLAGNSSRTLAEALAKASVSSFMYRYILRESCSQFDSLPLTSLTDEVRRQSACSLTRRCARRC